MKNITLLLIFCFLSILGYTQTKEATKNYELGNQFMNKKDYRKAIEYYSTSIDLEPAADAYFNRALSYLRLQDTCKYCKDMDATVRLFNDQEASKYFYLNCVHADTLVKLSDSIKAEFPECSYALVIRHKYDTDLTVHYFDKKNQEITSKYDQYPEFPGGEEAKNNFLANNIVYPIQAAEAGIQGVVRGSFIVKKDGSVSDIKIINGIGGGCNEEYIRVLKLMPRWKPATKHGVPVDFQFNMPIFFVTSEGPYTGPMKNVNKNQVKALENELALRGAPINNSYIERKADLAISNYKKGTQAMEAKQFDKAISYFNNSISKYAFANAFFNRAVAYLSLADTCHFCLDLKNAAVFNDNDALKLFKEKCCYYTLNYTLPNDMKLKLPNATHLEIQHETCSKDSTVYVVSKTNELIEKTELEGMDDELVFTIVEEMPSFPNGERALERYFSKNINYPEDAKKNHLQGVVYVQFIIEKEGSISHVKVVRGIGNSCDEEAKRVVRNMPKWSPGKQNGKPVRVRFNYPISFS